MGFLKKFFQKINFFFKFLLTKLKKYYIILFEKKIKFKMEEIMSKEKAKNGNSNGDEHGGKSKGRTSYNIPIDKLFVRPGFNPRMDFNKDKMKELELDIQEVGILQDLLVQPREEAKGTFWIVDGERRWKCAKKLKFDRVPCNILPAAMSELELIRYSYSTMKASTLNEIEEGGLFYRLVNNFGKNVQEIADIFKISIGTVNNRLKVYEEAPADKIQALKDGKIKFTNVLKEVRDGDSVIEKVVDPEKQKKKEWEKEIKSNISRFVEWLWEGLLENKTDKEKKELEENYVQYVNWLVDKYSKFKKKEKRVEEKEEEPEEIEENVSMDEESEEVNNSESESENEDEEGDVNLDDLSELDDIEDFDIDEKDLEDV